MSNAFTSLRPRGADAPAKLPTKKAGKLQLNFTSPSKVRGETRVLNSAGKWQAYLRPSTSIQIEDRAQGQSSTDKRRAIVRGSL